MEKYAFEAHTAITLNKISTKKYHKENLLGKCEANKIDFGCMFICIQWQAIWMIMSIDYALRRKKATKSSMKLKVKLELLAYLEFECVLEKMFQSCLGNDF